MELTISDKLLPLINIKKRFKIIIGGRGSGKSQTVCDIALMHSQTQALKIGFFREFQNSIEDSVHSLLCDEIKRLNLDGFNTQNNKITNNFGGEFKFKGLARNAESIKSMSGFDRFIIEEAQTISAESLTMLTPTLRQKESEIWMIANPQSSADAFSERFIAPFQHALDTNGYYEDDLHLIIVCNYKDNPWFPTVLEQERLFDKQYVSTAEYEHIWLGKFNDQVDNSIITTEWFNVAIDAHKKLGFTAAGTKIVAHDPSDLGPDTKGLCLMQGSVVLDMLENKKGDVNEGADWATNYAIENNADEFRWDCDGLGITLKRQIANSLSMTNIQLTMFRGSNTADKPEQIYLADESIERSQAKTNKQTFKNKRAQYYFVLRDRFYATYKAIKMGVLSSVESYISISSTISNIPQLRSEVCRIPKKANANGLLQIMSKIEMQKIKIKSPNLADSLMMCMTPQQSSVDGSYYSKTIGKMRLLGRIGHVPYDALLPVNTYWSIGDDDAVAIWFAQVRGNEKRLIDYYQNSGESIAHYIALLDATKYVYDSHYLPFDNNVKNNDNVGQRIVDMVANIGLKSVIRVNKAKNQNEVQAGILNTRNFLMQCWIDAEKCEIGIGALENYRKEYDEKNMIHKKSPLNDWAAKGADALITGVTGQRNNSYVDKADLLPELVAEY